MKRRRPPPDRLNRHPLGLTPRPAWRPATKLALCSLLLGLLLPLPGLATGADVRIIVDTSGSMQRADPDNLRGPALSLLLRLLPRDVQAGIWSFDGEVRNIAQHQPVDALWKTQADIQLKVLKAAGQRSHLPAALAAATWDRASTSGARPRHLILVTDGRIDLSDDDAVNRRARWTLLAQTVPELAAAGFRVHTLVLGTAGEPQLLRMLAQGTDGLHLEVREASAIQAALLQIFEHLGVQAELPLQSDTRAFQVDGGISELTLLWYTEPAGAPLRLELPGGARVQGAEYRSALGGSPDLHWHRGPDYELVTIPDPPAGMWRVDTPGQGRILAIADLGLAVPGAGGVLVPGEINRFSLVLQGRQGPVHDPAFLSLVRLEAALVDAARSRPVAINGPAADGSFQLRFIGPDKEISRNQPLELQVHAIGPTFQRRLSLALQPTSPVEVEVHPAADGATLWLSVPYPGLSPDTLEVAAALAALPGPDRWLVPEKTPAGLWKLPVRGAPGKFEVTFDIQAKQLSGEDFSLRTESLQFTLPLTEPLRFFLNGQGERPRLPLLGEALAAAPAGSTALPQPPGAATPPPGLPPAAEDGAVPAGREASPEMPAPAQLPWPFAGGVGLLNLLLAAALWWFLKPAPNPVLGRLAEAAQPAAAAQAAAAPA